jgi:hypothetical protein
VKFLFTYNFTITYCSEKNNSANDLSHRLNYKQTDDLNLSIFNKKLKYEQQLAIENQQILNKFFFQATERHDCLKSLKNKNKVCTIKS